MKVVAGIFCVIFFSVTEHVLAEPRFFAGYDIGQMAFHKFNHFAGEVGVKFENNQSVRMVYTDVFASAKEQESNFVVTVDGPNVEGTMKGVELFYDMPINSSNFYWSISGGYYEDTHRHIVLDESIEKKSPTLGAAIGYKENNIFGINHLYMSLSVPFRYYFNPIEETTLGETKISKIDFNTNIFFTIGFGAR